MSLVFRCVVVVDVVVCSLHFDVCPWSFSVVFLAALVLATDGSVLFSMFAHLSHRTGWLLNVSPALPLQYELFEEALLIYTKCGKKSEGEEKTAMHVSAVEVLVDNLKDLNRAKDFAERVADSAVWSKVRR